MNFLKTISKEIVSLTDNTDLSTKNYLNYKSKMIKIYAKSQELNKFRDLFLSNFELSPMTI